jgi:hypothetical protein
MEQKILFEEEQRFTQWYIWILLLGLLCIPVYGIIQQLVLKQPIGDKPMSDLGLVIILFTQLSLCLLFWILKIKTTISKEKISFRFFPFVTKTIPWDEVEVAEIVKYRFVGYGIRIFTSYGTVYNINGNKGMALTLTNKKKLLIGTQKPYELEDVIHSVLK